MTNSTGKNHVEHTVADRVLPVPLQHHHEITAGNGREGRPKPVRKPPLNQCRVSIRKSHLAPPFQGGWWLVKKSSMKPVKLLYCRGYQIEFLHTCAVYADHLRPTPCGDLDGFQNASHFHSLIPVL